jgi:hypothetical protein
MSMLVVTAGEELQIARSVSGPSSKRNCRTENLLTTFHVLGLSSRTELYGGARDL